MMMEMRVIVIMITIMIMRWHQRRHTSHNHPSTQKLRIPYMGCLLRYAKAVPKINLGRLRVCM